MARGCRRWQAEGGAGVGGNEVGHGLRLHLGHGHSLGLDCGFGCGLGDPHANFFYFLIS